MKNNCPREIAEAKELLNDWQAKNPKGTIVLAVLSPCPEDEKASNYSSLIYGSNLKLAVLFSKILSDILKDSSEVSDKVRISYLHSIMHTVMDMVHRGSDKDGVTE